MSTFLVQVLLLADLWLCVFREGPEGGQDRNLPQGKYYSEIIQFSFHSFVNLISGFPIAIK